MGLSTGTFLSFDYVQNDFILLSLVDFASRFLIIKKAKLEINDSIRICLMAQGGPVLFSTSIDGSHYIFLDIEVVDRCLNITQGLFYSFPYTSRFDPTRIPFYTMEEGTSRLIQPIDDPWEVPEQLRCRDKEHREAIPLCIFACTFLIAHELAHITNGHLSARADWMTLVSSKADFVSIRRTLEYDADAQAVVFFLSAFAASIIKSEGELKLSEKTRRLVISISIGLKAMEGAVSSRSLESHEYDSEKPYLTIGRRIYDCMLTICAWMHRCFPNEDPGKLDYLIRSDFLALEHLSVSVFHRGSAVLSLSEGLLNFGDSYAEIAATWQRLLPTLVRWKLGNHNLAP